MANKLYDNWTWGRKLPEPFTTSAKSTTDANCTSQYNNSLSVKATLHASSLSAILAYLELYYAENNKLTIQGAIGTQNTNIVSEYPSHTGNIQAVYYDTMTGKVIAGKFDNKDDPPQPYQLKDNKESGAALFFAIMPIAMEDEEFSEHFFSLLSARDGDYKHIEEAEKHAYILCDNLYRRIINNKIQITIPQSGNIRNFTSHAIDIGSYAPNTVTMGTFNFLTSNNVKEEVTLHENFVGLYALNDDRTFSDMETEMIPTLPEWYIIPPEIVNICKHTKITSASAQPMRNFMLRGPAGTGKTEGAKAIAAGLNLPYTSITCSANTEIYDLLGQILPDFQEIKSLYSSSEIPNLTDIKMDPSTAYAKLTGNYRDVTEDEVYDKLVEVLTMKAKEDCSAGADNSQQKFKYVDTEFVKAIKYGYVCEIQEPSIISSPGVLVGLNSLLDRCNVITLPTGEKINRHPDCVIIVTTNNDYAGCKDVNQSVISRMALVMDFEQPDYQTMAQRACNVTGCKNINAAEAMAQAVQDINKACKSKMITDGCCGMRELISWVQSYMICENELEAARYTILSSVSSDEEARQEIWDDCLATKFY